METETEPFSLSGSFFRFRFPFFPSFGSVSDFRVSVFSGRGGHRNRTVSDFRFGFSVSFSRSRFSGRIWKPKPTHYRFWFVFFGFNFSFPRFRPGFFYFGFSFFIGFGLVFAHLTFYNSIPVPSNQTRPKYMVNFYRIPFQFVQSQIP